MKQDLREKLEEAAEQAGINAFNNAYDNLETGEVCALCQEIAVENHRVGAKLGYKEAIAQAREWLKEHWGDYYAPVEWRNLTADFETDMNKLWEE